MHGPVDNSAQNWFGRKGKRDGQRADYSTAERSSTDRQTDRQHTSGSVCQCVCVSVIVRKRGISVERGGSNISSELRTPMCD